MAGDGRADGTQQGRFRVHVLLITFASRRWGEASALTRAELDLKARTVRIRAAHVERSTGPLVLGPPKSQAGRRIVGIPAAIVPDLESHLAKYSSPTPGRSCSPASWAARSDAATSTSWPPGRTRSRHSACRGCTST